MMRPRMRRPTATMMKTCTPAMASTRRDFGKFGLLAGVRVESTHATYRGNLYNSDTDTNTPATQSQFLHQRLSRPCRGATIFCDNLIGRLTYSSGIARPGFDADHSGGVDQRQPMPASRSAIRPQADHRPEFRCHVGVSTPAMARSPLSACSTSSSAITSCCRSRLCRATTFPGLTGVTTVVQSYSNGPAHAYGLEAQYQQQLKFLPQPWNGFGYSANVTWVDSEAQIHPGIDGLLPSTSRLTWNAAVFYERSPLELRLAADYVGQNLFSFGSITGNATDVYSRHRLTMDFGASYADHARVQVSTWM